MFRNVSDYIDEYKLIVFFLVLQTIRSPQNMKKISTYFTTRPQEWHGLLLFIVYILYIFAFT